MPSIDVNRTTLNYRFDGPQRGPVVMLSNSLASNLSMWELQVPALIEAGYRVLRYDSRGHGGSAVPEGPYTMDLLTSDAVGLMDALGLDKVHFCGLSMGGMVGQMLGRMHADRLISLVLCSTSAYIGPRNIWDERIGMVQERGMEAIVDATIDRWFTKPGQDRLPSDVEKVRKMILNTSSHGFCACCAAIRDMDQRESITTVSAQTLVMVGEHDVGTPVSAAELIHEKIETSALKIIPDAAHLINIEQETLFNKNLLEFLREFRKEY